MFVVGRPEREFLTNDGSTSFCLGITKKQRPRSGKRRPDRRERTTPMGTADKVSNKIEDLKGQAKEATGRIRGDKDLEAEGQIDQVKAAAKEAGEKVKDVGSKAKRMVQS
jgi:uncharacterized protein YjbJ (UPF0337 family)